MAKYLRMIATRNFYKISEKRSQTCMHASGCLVHLTAFGKARKTVFGKGQCPTTLTREAFYQWDSADLKKSRQISSKMTQYVDLLLPCCSSYLFTCR